MSGSGDPEAMQGELAILRERVSELQRRLAAQRAPDDAAIGVGIGISEREELLLEAERIAHMGSWVWDISRDRISWSDELFRILGYRPATDTPSAEAFFLAVHPDDRARVRAASADGVARGIAEQVDFRVLRSDGTVRYVSMNGAFVFDEAGGVRQAVGTILDVTDSRHAREQLERSHELLAEAQAIAHVGSWVLDLETNRIEWSAELHRIFGTDPSQPVGRDHLHELTHPDDRARVQQYTETLARGEVPNELEARVVRPNGEVRYFRTRSRVRKDAGGEVKVLCGTVLDITEPVRSRERRAQAQKMEALGRLAGGVAHDFNNLLTVLGINVELLAEQQGSPSREIDDIQSALASAKSLTDGLLAFGRKAQLERRHVSPGGLVERTMRLLRRLVDAPFVLHLEVEPGLPAIHVDPVQVEQGIVNLVVNARDAMPRGGSIHILVRSPQEGEVEIAVRDEGEGMDEATSESAFEPFFSTKAHGHGLGLATVLGSVEQHGGRMHVDSAPGRGTTVSMIFPASAEPVSPIEPFARESTRETASPGRPVLLVEDGLLVASAIARTLERRGHEVIVATSPSAAIATFGARDDIAAVICDVALPEMRGPDLIARLAEGGRKPRVLFVTGHGDETVGDVEGALVIRKPFHHSLLVEKLDALLDA